MEAYRITHVKWADKLIASGYPGRWNSLGINIIYAAKSRSLSCLENIVHRNKKGLNDIFRTMVIYMPDDVKREIISIADLPEGWHESSENGYTLCRDFGDAWALSGSSPVLFVPSAIVKNEFNVLLNANHPDFERIKIIDIEPFFFDPRVKL